MSATIDITSEGSAAQDRQERQRAQAAADKIAADLSGLDAAQLWVMLAEPETPQDFHAAWLVLLCSKIVGAASAVLIIDNEQGSFAPVALWPNAAVLTEAVQAAAEIVINRSEAIVHPLGTTRADGLAVGYPLLENDKVMAAVVVTLGAEHAGKVTAAFRTLVWGAGLLNASLAQRALRQQKDITARAVKALDILAATQDETALKGAAMALVNELAVALGAARVSIGLPHGRRMRLMAISNAARFDRRTDDIEMLELAMDEAAAQQGPVIYPMPPGPRRKLDIAHRELASQRRLHTVSSVPLIAGRIVVGVVSVEHATAPDAGSAETLQLTADLAAPLIRALRSESRLISGALPRFSGTTLRTLLGPRHPGFKLLALAASAAVAGLVLIETPMRVTARAVIEGEVQRAAVAPFDGYVLRASVRAGDTVAAGDELASLDDRDLRFERSKWESEKQKLEQRQREALGRMERAVVQQLGAQIAQAEAELKLVLERLSRTRITAPIAGFVISGDLSQLLGSPVQQGKILFEIAPLDAYRVVLQVDETDYRLVSAGQAGTLVLTGTDGATHPVTISRITTVSQPRDGRNTFRIEAAVQGMVAGPRPGMEGVAKFDVGSASMLRVWTRTLIDRINLFIWAWTP